MTGGAVRVSQRRMDGERGREGRREGTGEKREEKGREGDRDGQREGGSVMKVI